MIFIERSMKIVGATLCDESDLRSRGTPLVGVRVSGRHPKFLNGIQCDRQDRRECTPVYLVIHINTVESDVALVAASAIHGAATSIHISIHVSAIAGVGNARLQREQVRNVASL